PRLHRRRGRPGPWGPSALVRVRVLPPPPASEPVPGHFEHPSAPAVGMVPPARGDRLQGGLRVGLAGARGPRDPRANRGLAGPSSEGGDPGTDPGHERREAADVTLRPPDEPGQTFI